MPVDIPDDSGRDSSPANVPVDKPPPEPQVIVKEKTSAWSKTWAIVCGFFSLIWTTITGWYTTDFARPLIDKARDNATNNITLDLLPQIALLLGTVVVIGVIAVLFLWLGVWIWNHEKNRVSSINEAKMLIAADPKKSTVEFTSNPTKATANILSNGGNNEP